MQCFECQLLSHSESVLAIQAKKNKKNHDILMNSIIISFNEVHIAEDTFSLILQHPTSVYVAASLKSRILQISLFYALGFLQRIFSKWSPELSSAVPHPPPLSFICRRLLLTAVDRFPPPNLFIVMRMFM